MDRGGGAHVLARESTNMNLAVCLRPSARTRLYGPVEGRLLGPVHLYPQQEVLPPAPRRRNHRLPQRLQIALRGRARSAVSSDVAAPCAAASAEHLDEGDGDGAGAVAEAAGHAGREQLPEGTPRDLRFV